MPEKSNFIFKFWNELKRRKVFRVVAMYAGTAFIIMEAADIMLPRLGLPDWTVTIIIILLIIGFPITIIFSWIYDFTPEGWKKTKLADAVTEEIIEPGKRKFRVSDGIIIILIVVVCILLYPKIFKKDKFHDIRDSDGRISIAVMPFENLTGDTTLNFFQRGISTIISNELGTSEELSVLDDQTLFEVFESAKSTHTASLIPVQEREIAQKVKARIYLTGNYQGSQSSFRILVNLIDTQTGEIIFGEKMEGNLIDDYLKLTDSLSVQIKKRLEIKTIQKDIDHDLREAFTDYPEAYKYYITGVNSISIEDYTLAVDYLKKALEIDSTFTFAAFYLAWAYNYNFENEQAKTWTQKAYLLKDNLPVKYQLWLELWRTCYFDKDLDKMIHYCEQLEKIDIKSRFLWFDLGATLSGFPLEYGKLDKAVQAFEKVMEISLDWGGYWKYLDYYLRFGDVLHWSGMHEEESKIYDIGLDLFPQNQYILSRKAVCALSRDDLNKEKYVDNYIQRMIEMGLSKPDIELNLGKLYLNANLVNQAEKHLRSAYNLDSQNFLIIRDLANLLINYDIGVSEGLELVNNALARDPSNKNLVPHLLKAQGWGYYKIGEYHLALQSLKSAKENFYFYDHVTNLHIREVEQALAKQKSEQ